MGRSAFVILGLIGLLSCAPPDPASLLEPTDDDAWHVEGNHEMHGSGLPEARQGRRRPPPVGSPPFVLHVLEDGNLWACGTMWRLLSGTPTMTHAALLWLRTELDARTPDRLQIRAFGSAPWRAVLEVLHTARDARVDQAAIEFVTRPHDRTRGLDTGLGARLVSWPKEEQGEPRTVMTLRIREVAAPGFVQIVVDTHPGDEARLPEAYEFPPGTQRLTCVHDEYPRDIHRQFEWANHTWQKVAESLRDARSPAAIVIPGPSSQRHLPHAAYDARAIIRGGDEGDLDGRNEETVVIPPLPPPPPPVADDQELPWAFVVTTMDLLLQRGIRTIGFPEEGFALEFNRRHVGPPPPLAPLRTPPILRDVAIVLGAGALAFVVAAAGLKRVRRRNQKGGIHAAE